MAQRKTAQGFAGFSGADDPTLPRDVRRLDEKRREQWVETYNARFTPVAKCRKCGKELIADEERQHNVNHLSSRARRIVGMFDMADKDTQREVEGFLAK